MKFPGQKHQASVSIVKAKDVKGEYTADDSGKFKVVALLEARGLVPTAWHPRMDFAAISSGGKVRSLCFLKNLIIMIKKVDPCFHAQQVRIVL